MLNIVHVIRYGSYFKRYVEFGQVFKGGKNFIGHASKVDQLSDSCFKHLKKAGQLLFIIASYS